MVADKIKKIQKRDGRVVDFDQQKITDAIEKAVTASGQGDGEESKRVSDKVVELLNRRFRDNGVPQVEQIQDIVEETLIAENLAETAKAYILYREQRRRIREAAGGIDESLEMIDKYIKELDWQVYENANMAYSLQGLNHYGVSALTKRSFSGKMGLRCDNPNFLPKPEKKRRQTKCPGTPSSCCAAVLSTRKWPGFTAICRWAFGC